MKLKTVKSQSEIVLEGIVPVLELVDGNFASLTLTDVKGRQVKIVRLGYSDVVVTIPAPPATQKKFELAVDVAGAAVIREQFEHEHEAQTRLGEIESKAGYPKWDHKITPVEVEVPF